MLLNLLDIVRPEDRILGGPDIGGREYYVLLEYSERSLFARMNDIGPDE
jgi:hypothetical protein